jgi:hypothetical protein
MAASQAQSLVKSAKPSMCSTVSQDIHDIINGRGSVAQILRALYEYHRLRYKQMSLTYICRHTGIASKGYLAYVLAGKRRLNEKYWTALCSTFKLTPGQSSTLIQRLREEAGRDLRAHNSQGV